jgi:hypothetical protein
MASIQLLETSHAAKVKIEQNVLQFYFENIQLADSFSNEPESHGYVLYKMKTKSNLQANSTVKNKAEIYFDYNLPVITNTATTTFYNALGIDYPSQNIHFQCYPNPVQNILTIETEKENAFLILNVLGEEVKREFIREKGNVEISNLPKGIYWIKEANAASGLRFVKE